MKPFHPGGRRPGRGNTPLYVSRLISLLLALLLSLPAGVALASEEEGDTSTFVAPTLPEGAPAYDSSTPDILDRDMLYAQSAIVVEAVSGNVIFEKNADAVMYPASTTKIMTAYMALQMGVLDDVVTTSIYAATQQDPDASTIPIVAGEEVVLKDLLTATMLRSGNDGAIAIAEHIGGTEAFFVEMMNDAALYFGCTNTHFTNSHGLHDPNHYTTARDMSIIAQQAMQDDTFRQIVATVNYSMPASNRHPSRNLVNGNLLLRSEEEWYYPEAIGVKTGYTSQAGYCLVAAAEYQGIELISVVFYSSRAGRWSDTTKLLNYGFAQYESVDPISVYNENPRVVNITGFQPQEMADGSQDLGELELEIQAVDPDRDVYMVGTKDEIAQYKSDFNQISHVNWTRELRAPVTKGEVMGILTFYPRDGDEAEYQLIASRSIEARADAPPTLEEIQAYTLEDSNPFPRFSFEYLLPPLALGLAIFLLIFLLRRRRRKRKKLEKKLPKPTRRTFH